MSSTIDYTVFGGARSGVAAAELLTRHGFRVFVSDQGSLNANQRERLLRDDILFEEGGHTERALEAATGVISPGIRLDSEIVLRARANGMEILSEIEVAASFCRATQVGITGTNGKTTTTELTAHLLTAGGIHAVSVGNVGTPFSSISDSLESDAVAVIELSSYQLELSDSQRLEVGVILNVTPDHLDRYDSFEDYVAAKARIAGLLTESDLLILNHDDPSIQRLRSAEGDYDVQTFSLTGPVETGAWVGEDTIWTRISGETLPLIDIGEMKLAGPHNWQNGMAAALIALRLGCSRQDVVRGLAGFEPLPHRLQLVGEFAGVSYVNDSKATNTAALEQALRSYDRPIVLIAGGISKNNKYDALLPLIEKHVRHVVVIGEAADEIDRALRSSTMIEHAGTDFRRAVEMARQASRSGDVVLLSPACASFDMFDSFEHRGDVFTEIVAEMSAAVIDEEEVADE